MFNSYFVSVSASLNRYKITSEKSYNDTNFTAKQIPIQWKGGYGVLRKNLEGIVIKACPCVRNNSTEF